MDGTEMSGMAIGPMPPTAAKPTGMGGMWMGGSTVIGPIPPLTSAPTAGNSGRV
ncbi:Uncharacterised protein [Mycobacterium tuberculosis]|uniref:Uncharacterized protein n=1 Tax=Mycobacterium tuberculosis TaxID=1773 RepID=A0A655CLL2_MYCTX|nr:Uncharacterised protein [Mycobacterium tuberculosis]CKR83841.1 Uncharacterised protein [Mycobacterium tuberculosis]CKS56419.1 Uncharacterised protein [Mycobacterium tuberculosis]CKS58913.1 Uncharacterised protein [Mycobacterium tuberculosis]CMP13326.1 Uncharacterised protein [Mycobacterium tuberculosis]